MGITVIAALAAACVSALIAVFATSAYQKKNADTKIGDAEGRARKIIDDALESAKEIKRESEEKKRESLLEVKEESLKAKNELEKEMRERRAEVQRSERRICG